MNRLGISQCMENGHPVTNDSVQINKNSCWNKQYENAVRITPAVH